MYVVSVFNDKQEKCTFECNTFSESYDNTVQRRELTFVKKSNLEGYVSGFSILEGSVVNTIEIKFNDKVIATYTDYPVYTRASIEYPEDNPDDAQGVVHFEV